VVDEIWLKYDTDRNGKLDKREAKRFIQDTLRRRIGGSEGFLKDDIISQTM